MEKYRNFSPFFHFDSDPDFPHFYYMLGGNLGSLLYGDVSVMFACELDSSNVLETVRILSSVSSDPDNNF